MDISLTHREIELVIDWKSEADWPDELRVLAKLRDALDGTSPLSLSRVQLKIVRVWVEEQVGGHYGAPVMNLDEQSILEKLVAALGEYL